MTQVNEQDVVTVREIPRAPLAAIAWFVLAVALVATAAWEWRMRSLGLVAGDLADGKSSWAVERRKLESGEHDGVVLIGGSRILFDTNLDVFQENTGRRPVQLAMPGWNGQPVLKDIAENSRFAGLVVMDDSPTQLFRQGGGGHPLFTGVLEYWRDEGPARRASHRIENFLSRWLAFLDDNYSLMTLIDRVDIPNRGRIRGPYLSVWKLSERYADRQYVMWRKIETNERLRQHAIRVWLGRDLPPVSDEVIAGICADIARSVEKIRARGGEVVFLRPPSTGDVYTREEGIAPRVATWDRMLRESRAFGINFEDYPNMQGLNLPDLSHLTREDASRFTRAYVDVLLREGHVGLRTPLEAEPAG